MRKKLFAVIMSVMMMVTFMPTMAFADVSGVKWSKDFDTVSWTDGTNSYSGIPTVRSLVYSGNQWTGKIKVEAKNHTEVPATYYYDLNNSYVSEVNGEDWNWGQTGFTLEKFTDMFGYAVQYGIKYVDDVELTFTAPSYIKNYSVSSDATASLDADDIDSSVSFKIAVPKFDETKAYTEDQTFTLPVLVSSYTPAIAEKLYGNVPEKTMTVKKTDFDVTTITYDNGYGFNKKAGVDFTWYNGAEQEYAQIELPNVTSTYELFGTDNKWAAADSIKVKNVDSYYVKATAKKGTGTKELPTKEIEVIDAGYALVGFKGTSFNVAGKFNAQDFLKVTPVVYDSLSDNASAVKAIKAAVKADEKAIMECFNAFYEITNEGSVYSIVPRELTTKEINELKDKYETLIKNYGVYGFDTAIDTATFKVVDDVEFTTAPLTKTYKYKTLKKGSKKFKIKAKSSNGSSLYYKLTKGAGKIKINKSTGEVTVKKGIKKGTYKVGVYAISLDDKDVYNNYTLKIKVK